MSPWELCGKRGKESMARATRKANDSASVYPSVKALAEDLGMCERSTRDALRRDEIPHRKIGNRYILPRAAIAEWLRTAGRRPVATDLR